MNKLNPYYLFLQENVSLLDMCFEGLEAEEETNDTLKTCLLFMTIDRLASKISRDEGYGESIVHACVALSYTDVYRMSTWILEDFKRAE